MAAQFINCDQNIRNIALFPEGEAQQFRNQFPLEEFPELTWFEHLDLIDQAVQLPCTWFIHGGEMTRQNLRDVACNKTLRAMRGEMPTADAQPLFEDKEAV